MLLTQKASLRRRLWFTLLVNLAYVLWLRWHPVSSIVFKGINDCFAITVGFLGAWWGLKTSRSKENTSGSKRQQWVACLMGASMFSFALGQTVWFYYEILRHWELPFPSWADVYFLASYPLLMIAVLLMPTRPIPAALRGRVLLDSLMVMTGLVTFSWYFLLGPTILQGSETLMGRVLGVGYPIGDLAILFCLLIISAHPAEEGMRSSRRLVVGGILTYVVADVGFGYMTLKGTYVNGQFTDAGWTIGNLLIGLAAVSYRQAALATPAQEADLTAEQRNPVLWRAMLPYAFVPAVGLLLLYLRHHSDNPKLEPGVYVGSAVLVALVGLRQVFALSENHRLYRYLQDAYHEQEKDRRSLAESNARLETLATTDTMTGLANHRAFQERIRQELAQAKRTKRPVSLLLMDVDRFKHYNDSFGHPAGDEALRIVARLLKENLRSGDFPARYGGEEFAVILPETEAAAATSIAERIRAVVEAYSFPHRAVTLSIGGVVSVPGEEAETLIKQADASLYVAKHRGRNGVCFAEPGLDPTVFPARDEPLALSEREALAVSGLLAALCLRDGETQEHSERVTRYALRLAEEAVRNGVIELTGEDKQALLLGSLLHDVGKIGTPDHILLKPGRLEPGEWAQMCKHPALGIHLLTGLPSLRQAQEVVLHHHDHWNGTGYPGGLAEAQIPLLARLFSIVDALDAMTSDRPYRQALSFRAAQEEVARVSGSQFDPALVQVFLTVPSGEWERLKQEGEVREGISFEVPFQRAA